MRGAVFIPLHLILYIQYLFGLKMQSTGTYIIPDITSNIVFDYAQ